MTDNEMLQQLQDLEYTHAPKALHEKFSLLTEALPDKHAGFYFPLFAFQMALVFAALFVLVGFGSGVVVAAAGSPKGTPLYPVRLLLHKVAPAVVKEDVESTPVPTATPTPVPKATPTGEKHKVRGVDQEDEHEELQEDHSLAPTGIQHAIQNVAGEEDKSTSDDQHTESESNFLPFLNK